MMPFSSDNDGVSRGVTTIENDFIAATAATDNCPDVDYGEAGGTSRESTLTSGPAARTSSTPSPEGASNPQESKPKLAEARQSKIAPVKAAERFQLDEEEYEEYDEILDIEEVAFVSRYSSADSCTSGLSLDTAILSLESTTKENKLHQNSLVSDKFSRKDIAQPPKVKRGIHRMFSMTQRRNTEHGPCALVGVTADKGEWQQTRRSSAPTLPKEGIGNSQSEDKLRHTYLTQSEQGEKHYSNENYAMAIASFNDAKMALLIIAGLSKRKFEAGCDGGAMYANLINRVNLALLLERITDCYVQDFFDANNPTEPSDDDFSFINYHKSTAMLAEIKGMLMAEIESSNNVDEIVDLKDLSNEATISLARIFSKLGCVCAKLGDHSMALDTFGDCLSVWQEVTNKNLQGGASLVSDAVAVDHDPLILETHDAITSYCDKPKDASRISNGAHSQKSIISLKALSTALQMANSHHALGVEAASPTDSELVDLAIHHHLYALKLTRDAERIQKTFNDPLQVSGSPSRSKSTIEFAGNTMGATSIRQRPTPDAHDISYFLMAQSQSKDTPKADREFTRQCALLVAQQQLCISHACFRLGLKMISRKWLSEAIDTVYELGLSDTREVAVVTVYMISVLVEHDIASNEKAIPSKSFSLYEGGLPAFTGCREKPKMLLHFGMAALETGMYIDAKTIFKRKTAQICNTPNPPDHYHDMLWAINALIIIELKECNMGRASREMNRRLNIVTYWFGTSSLERAKDLHRLGCFYSLLGQHDKCAKRLEESLHIGSAHDDYEILDSTKLLATTYDAMNAKESAIREYELALCIEKDSVHKARLMNALSYLYIKTDGQSQLAIDYLEKSLKIQHDDTTSGDEDSKLTTETMILYGNAMVSQKSFPQAINWYESALKSNSDKNPLERNNLRAWYNKGVTLFRRGDMTGADSAFGIILDEVEKKSTVPPGTAFVIIAIGNCYFAKKDYAEACKQFKNSLSLKNNDLSPRQRAETLCNIATTYYMLGDSEESENHLNKALKEVGLSNDRCFDFEASIMCNIACILYKSKYYLRAYRLYSKAASIGESNRCEIRRPPNIVDNKTISRCNAYAEMCRLDLINQKIKNEVLSQKQEVIAQKPHFRSGLIPVSAGPTAPRHSGAVYSRERKILAALGVELQDLDSIELASEDDKVACDIALEYLLQQTEDSRAQYELQFAELLGEQIDSKFRTMKTLMDTQQHILLRC